MADCTKAILFIDIDINGARSVPLAHQPIGEPAVSGAEIENARPGRQAENDAFSE